jgi:ATP-binding cassette subfamily B protein
MTAAREVDGDARHPRSLGVLRYFAGTLRGWPMAGLAFSFALMVVAAWTATVPAALLGRLVDGMGAGAADGFVRATPILVAIGACIVTSELATWLRQLIVQAIAARLEKSELVGLVSHLLRVDVLSLTRERVGALNVRVHRSVEGMARMITMIFAQALPTLIQAAVAIALAAPRHYSIAIAMTVVMIAGSTITMAQIASQRGIRLSLFKAREDLGGNFNELLWGVEYVRAQGLVDREVEQTAKVAERLRRQSFNHHRWMTTFDFAKRLVEGGGFLAVVAMGAWLAARGSVSKGDVLTFAVLYGSVTRPLRDLHRVIDDGAEALLMVRELIDLRGLPVDVGLHGTASPETGSELVVEARSCSVKYELPTGPHWALRDVNLTVRTGDVVGIAGPSGSGKTTLLAALLGLIGDYSGSLELFGHEVRELDKEALAKLVSYVPQSPFIRMGTLRDNLSYSVPGGVTDPEILDAVAKAQLADVLQRSDAGLDALISEQGRDLSGGERQRIMLARVFLRRGQLLVLDEATSALDSENEVRVQRALAEIISRSAATLIVAHRLSTLSITNKIVVVNEGSIVQEGTFDMLSRAPGLFRDLLMRQDVRPPSATQRSSQALNGAWG